MSFLCKILGHRWQNEDGVCRHVCARCQKSEALSHDWHHCACRCCGELRNGPHDWMQMAVCERLCRVCGAQRQQHHWQPVDRGIDKCCDCGKTHKLTAEEIAERDEQWENRDE